MQTDILGVYARNIHEQIQQFDIAGKSNPDVRVGRSSAVGTASQRDEATIAGAIRVSYSFRGFATYSSCDDRD
jgi:hypothetical protein